MTYDTLASYYDDLVKDEQATQDWVQWIQRFQKPCDFLELACGSGEITHCLENLGYTMTALDLSQPMIDRAKAKDDRITFTCQDMKDLSNFGQFDAIACLCDSFNYILSKAEIEAFFKEVAMHLKAGGHFFFDTHTLDRLKEFHEEWNETGTFEDGLKYQWSITSEDDWIYQDFAFYLKNGQVIQEHHLQRVYEPEFLAQAFQKYFTVVDVCTDFFEPGICEGEKYFYVLERKAEI